LEVRGLGIGITRLEDVRGETGANQSSIKGYFSSGTVAPDPVLPRGLETTDFPKIDVPKLDVPKIDVGDGSQEELLERLDHAVETAVVRASESDLTLVFESAFRDLNHPNFIRWVRFSLAKIRLLPGTPTGILASLAAHLHAAGGD